MRTTQLHDETRPTGRESVIVVAYIALTNLLLAGVCGLAGLHGMMVIIVVSLIAPGLVLTSLFLPVRLPGLRRLQRASRADFLTKRAINLQEAQEAAIEADAADQLMRIMQAEQDVRAQRLRDVQELREWSAWIRKGLMEYSDLPAGAAQHLRELAIYCRAQGHEALAARADDLIAGFEAKA